MGDMVNHPEHYKGKTSLECIQTMNVIFGEDAVAKFCLCNAYKYMWRFQNKNGAQDLDKALWYLTYAENVTGLDLSNRIILRRLENLYVECIKALETKGDGGE